MDDVRTLATTSNLGLHLQEVGDLDEAIDLLADTFERCKRQAPSIPITWRTGRRLSLAVAKAGRTNQGVVVAGEVLADGRRVLGSDNLTTLEMACCLATCLRLDGRVDEAMELLADTVERAGKATCTNLCLRSGTDLPEICSHSRCGDDARQVLERMLVAELSTMETVRPDRAASLRALLPSLSRQIEP
ncbi:MAG TPA: tetratricopeptide repeat protein [Acidimicrobiales bacterium]|nr:tetratricopeptide repeat protein [Acidimicrobiales bacterium]